MPELETAKGDGAAETSRLMGRRGAVAILCLHAAALLALLPVAAQPGPVLPGVTPAFVAVTLATELPTSFLLFARFRATRAWSILLLGCAYLFGGAMAVLHALTFPGAFLPERSILGPPQAAAWGYVLWLNGFAALTLAATAIEAVAPGLRLPHGRARSVALLAGAVTLAASIAVALVALLLADVLPPLMRDGSWTVLNQAVTLLAFAMLGMGIALGLLRGRRDDDLFLLLVVALAALLAANLISLAGGGRYTIGWSAGRLSWLVSACILFLFFLAEAARHTRLLAQARDLLDQRVAERTAELARALEQRELLVREVDHRAKNALTMVQSVLRLTRSDDPRAFARAVEGRVATLARAQGLLAEVRWTEVDLCALLGGELAAFLPVREAIDDAPGLHLHGPRVMLLPVAAQPVSMIAHELATNATKYGALSAAGGRVTLSWWREEAAGTLRLRWAETGGPPVPGPPGRRGFGSRVIETVVVSQLGGTVARQWEADGLVCDIALPLARVAAIGRADGANSDPASGRARAA